MAFASASRALFLALVTPACALAGETTQPPAAPAAPPDCSAAEHRQFDFWLGHWDVTGPKGKLLGRNTITRSPSGCWITEQWQSGPGASGTSLNAWDAQYKRWRQFWVGSDGGVLRLEGALHGKAMVLEGVLPTASGGGQQQRITWTPHEDGSVTQHWETSDDGKSWATAFLGLYRRSAAAAP